MSNFKISFLTAAILLAAAARADSWDEKFYNPQPGKDDIILPMPCGGAMAFRKIATDTQKPLEDKAIILGSDADSDGYAEHATKNYIGGGFADKNGGRYFLMGKYEVNTLQYRVVMDGECPTANLKGRLPATSLSWFDAVAFANKYSEWLLANASDKMPKEDGISGFLRLPTNNEWEYAARGGSQVSPSQFREDTPPMPEGLSKYAWFAGPNSANGKLQLTGLLKPNPLGLYDMLGNAGEFVFDPFRMNKLDRYHGQNGGVTVRGGSYLSPENSITSAMRIERPYYNSQGKADSAKDLGFRVAVGAPVITSKNRIKELEAEWQQLGRDNAKDDSHGAGANVVGQIEDLSKAVSQEQLKKEEISKQLNEVNAQLRAANQARDEQRDKAIQANLRLGAFLCADIVDLNNHYQDALSKVQKKINYCQTMNPNAPLCQTLADDQDERDSRKNALDLILTYYADTIVSTTEAYSEASILTQVDKVGMHQASNLSDFGKLYVQHLQGYYRNGKISKENWLQTCYDLGEKRYRPAQ